MKNRGNLATALILIAVGAWFLTIELVPAVKDFAYGPLTWPLPILGIGALLALVGLLTWTPGVMIPAAIVGGIGGLLYWQNTTGNWESWAYAWALIPCFVGAGLLLSGLMERNRGTLVGGFLTIFVGLVQFALFGSFLGGRSIIWQWWPMLLIALGLVLVSQGVIRKRA